MENWNEWLEKQNQTTITHLNQMSKLVEDSNQLFEYILKNFNYEFYKYCKNTNILSKDVFLFLVYNQELYGEFLYTHSETIKELEVDETIDFIEVDEQEEELFLYTLEQIIDFFLEEQFQFNTEDIKTYATIQIQ